MSTTVPVTGAGIPEHWRWFAEARFGLFIHWGPYALYGRGEQVLFREHLDQHEYAQRARSWDPEHYDAASWARIARDGGFRYAVLTARHHDGYCLWDSHQTDYTSTRSAPRRDFLREYVDAFRAAGLRVGLYYSLGDFRSKAYWSNPREDPQGWQTYRKAVHEQVRELLTNYGRIDVLWFDGPWPHSAADWDSEGLIRMIRELQPGILINNRLDAKPPWGPPGDAVEAAGESRVLGDFSTPEQRIAADPDRLWESCMTSTWRLWGYAVGERWRSAAELLDKLCAAASKGGNLLLNVGPQADGRIPDPFIERTGAIGAWLATHGQAIYGTERGDVTEFVTKGWQTRRGNTLYLIYRFWPGQSRERIAEFDTRVIRATLLTTGQTLGIEQRPDAIYLSGLPASSPSELFPVIQLDFEAPPQPKAWAQRRLWNLDPLSMQSWAIE